MKALVNEEAVLFATLRKINQSMQNPLQQANPDHPGQNSDHQGMNRRMGQQPPFPTQRVIATLALLHRHAIRLQAKVSEEVAHGQQGKKIRALSKRHGKKRQSVPVLGNLKRQRRSAALWKSRGRFLVSSDLTYTLGT